MINLLRDLKVGESKMNEVFNPMPPTLALSMQREVEDTSFPLQKKVTFTIEYKTQFTTNPIVTDYELEYLRKQSVKMMHNDIYGDMNHKLAKLRHMILGTNMDYAVAEEIHDLFKELLERTK